MDFELKKPTTKKIGLYGEVFEVTLPTLEEAEELEALKQNAEPKEHFKIAKAYIIKKGIPEAALSKLQMDDFLSLVKYIGGGEKKS